jgi:uncharacterized membrane protein
MPHLHFPEGTNQMKQRKSVLTLIGVIVIAGIDSAYHYPLLPEKMATHFGPSGQADGWMPRDAFMVMNASLMLFTALLLGSIRTLLQYLPDDSINLPNKEYWLATEQREQTLSILSSYFLWFAVATSALLAAVTHLVYRANLAATGSLSSLTWVILGAYLVFTLCWTVSLTRRFKFNRENTNPR